MKSKNKTTTEQLSEQEQQASQSSDQSQAFTGSTTATSNPFAASEPLLQAILGQAGGLLNNSGLTGLESAGVEGLAGTGDVAAGFVPEVGGLLTKFLQGQGAVGQAASTVTDALNPIARGDFLDPGNNTILQEAIQRGQNDALNAVTSRFSAGGRSFSPAEARAVAEGTSDVSARANLQQHQTEIARQLQAMGLLNSTAQGVEASQAAGASMIPGLTQLEQSPFRADLEAAAIERGIPLQNLGMLSNIVLPIASQFGTRTVDETRDSSGSTSGDSSGFSTGNVLGTNTQHKKGNALQTALGAAIGIGGLMTGNPMLMASGLGTAAGGIGGGGAT